MKKTVEFKPGLFYHEVLKANSDGILFRDAEDRNFFLNKIRAFILPCCEVWAYVILGNHVHLLLRPHPKEILARLPLQLHLLDLDLSIANLKEYLQKDFNLRPPYALKPFQGSIHFQIRYCIRSIKHSYDQYSKRKYETKGVLWSRDKFTKELPTVEDIARTVLYIHKNPVFHGIVDQPEDWQHSSYHEILGGENRMVMREDVLNLFRNEETFQREHFATASEFGRKPSQQKVALLNR